MHCQKLFRWIAKNNTRELSKLAGRPKLPGSNGKGFPVYLNEPTETRPYRIQAQDCNVNNDTSPEECAQAVGCVIPCIVYYSTIFYVFLCSFVIAGSASGCGYGNNNITIFTESKRSFLSV